MQETQQKGDREPRRGRGAILCILAEQEGYFHATRVCVGLCTAQHWFLVRAGTTEECFDRLLESHPSRLLPNRSFTALRHATAANSR